MIMRHPGRDKSANVVRKCVVSEVDDTKNEATNTDSWNATNNFEGKNEGQYETCSCDGVVGGPVIEHCVVWQLRNFSWNNQLPTSSATKLLTETKKSAGFPKQRRPPTRPYGITPQPTSVLTFVANNCGSHVRRKPLLFSRSSQTTVVLMFLANYWGSHVRCKPLRFSHSPPQKLQISSLISYIFNQTLSVSEILK